MINRRFQIWLAGLTTLFAAAVAIPAIDADTITGELISRDLYRLSHSVSVLTRGCNADGADIRVDRLNQKLIFLNGGIEECAIEAWVAPVSYELFGSSHSL